MDFYIVFDDHEYWEVDCHLSRRRRKFENLPKYLENHSHIVREIGYGADLCVQFPKNGFPTKDEVIKLFENRHFNEVQKKVKCRILLNYNQVEEWTLEQLLKYMKDLEGKKYSGYDIPVAFGYETLDQKIRKVVINNQDEFGQFLSKLYIVCRKIEMKMKKAGYPYVFQDEESKEKSFSQTCFNLENAKKDYKSMNRNNFLEMYPVLKRLFFCYIDYIRHSMEFVSNIDEGDYLPGTYEEIKHWLQKLNEWFPMKVNGEWIDCMGSFIAIPPGYEQIAEILKKTVKFNDDVVIIDDGVDEPYIGDENNKILFGFVDMKGAKAGEISESLILKSDCPKDCTTALKNWICTKCGQFVRSMLNSTGQQFLLCSCGSKKYRERFFTCHHRSHWFLANNCHNFLQRYMNSPMKARIRRSSSLSSVIS